MTASADQHQSGLAGAERTRRLIRGVATSGLGRILSVCAPVVVIPQALDLMGSENYGVWVTVTALTGMLLWSDLGLGNGLMTRVSSALAVGDEREARRVIASAYAMLGGAAVVVMGVLLVLAATLPWADLLNSKSDATGAIAVITLAAFVLNVPLGLIQRVQYSLGEVALNNVLFAIGPTLTIIGAFVATWINASPTQAVVILTSGPVIASLIATVVTSIRHRDLIPSRQDLALSAAGSLLSLGSVYLAVQVLSAVALNADNVIIAQVRGATEVVDYSIVARVFMVAGLVISLTNLPLWPANAQALAVGDVAWVRRTTRRMTLLSGGAMMLIGCTLIVVARPLVHVWIGPEVEVPWVLVAGFALFWSLVAAVSPAMMVQNSQAVLGPQLLGWALFACLSISAKVVLAAHGIRYMPLAAAALYALCLVPAAVLGYRRALTRSTDEGGSCGHLDASARSSAGEPGP